MKFTVDSGSVDPALPLIYLWQVFDRNEAVCFCYVGKAKGGAKRPMTHYLRNVRNLLEGNPYRKGKPDGFRAVHRRLADAEQNGLAIKLTFLCNVSSSEVIDAVERKWQRKYGCSHT